MRCILLLNLIADVFGVEMMVSVALGLVGGFTFTTPWNSIDVFQPRWEDIPFAEEDVDRMRNESSESYTSTTSSIHVGEYNLNDWDAYCGRHNVNRSTSDDSTSEIIVGEFELHSWDVYDRRTRSISL